MGVQLFLRFRGEIEPEDRLVGTAIAVSAFVTGVVVWFINPPSLSGAGGLASLIIGSTAFITSPTSTACS